jgi:hypothetical protein
MAGRFRPVGHTYPPSASQCHGRPCLEFQDRARQGDAVSRVGVRDQLSIRCQQFQILYFTEFLVSRRRGQACLPPRQRQSIDARRACRTHISYAQLCNHAQVAGEPAPRPLSQCQYRCSSSRPLLQHKDTTAGVSPGNHVARWMEGMQRRDGRKVFCVRQIYQAVKENGRRVSL